MFLRGSCAGNMDFDGYVGGGAFKRLVLGQLGVHPWEVPVGGLW